MKIIILSITQYKEKDGIVDSITEQGSLTFLAKSIFDPKSKNACLNTVLTIADIELQEGNYKYPVLKSINNVANPMLCNNSLDYLSSLMIMGEASKCLLQDEEKLQIYQTLFDAVTIIKTSDKPLLVAASVISKILKNAGYEFEVNRCVFCGAKKGISSFSFDDGGFVCKECEDEFTKHDLTVEQMFLIRDLFNNVQITINSAYYSMNNINVILSKFNDFIKDTIGFSLKSFSLLNN